MKRGFIGAEWMGLAGAIGKTSKSFRDFDGAMSQLRFHHFEELCGVRGL